MADEWKPHRDALRDFMDMLSSGDIMAAVRAIPSDTELWDTILAILLPGAGVTDTFASCYQTLAQDANAIDVVYKLLSVGRFI